MQIEAIAREYSFKVKSYKPLRAVYIAETDKGPIVIKETDREPDKLLYIHGMKEYLYESGFDALDRYLISENGLPFTVQDNRLFVVEKFIDGRECSFTNPFDREAAVVALAELHKKGKGYIAPTGAYKRENYGKWDNTYLKKIDYLVELKETIRTKKHKDFFDKMYLEDVDFMLDMAWQAYDTLSCSSYQEICKRARQEKWICHHDYTYHNIIITKDWGVSIIDFDYSCHELPVYDLANYILKVLKRFSFDIDMALRILNIYDSVLTINKEDLLLMLAIFEFPQRFWRIAERYYERKTDWSDDDFEDKYEDVFMFREYIKDFTSEFRKLI
ncbi:MAG: cotS1 [Clostridia bacterium]|jgi:CotS family spore coat protein|nr:cotS1 [Clostridia bacterium]